MLSIIFITLIFLVGYNEFVTKIPPEYIESPKQPVHVHSLYNLDDHFKYEMLEETESA